MAETLSHAELEQLLPAAALELLEGNELLEVTAHARECAQCALQLQSYREVVAGLASTLPYRPLDPARSARLRARVLARAAGKSTVLGGSAPGSTSKKLPAGWWAGSTGWAVAAGLAGLLLVHHSVHRPLAYGWLASGILTLVLLALLLYVGRQRARLSALEVRLEVLTGEASPPGVREGGRERPDEDLHSPRPK
jgi:hypothetical protein